MDRFNFKVEAGGCITSAGSASAVKGSGVSVIPSLHFYPRCLQGDEGVAREAISAFLSCLASCHQPAADLCRSDRSSTRMRTMLGAN